VTREILHVVDVPAPPGDVYEAIEGPDGLSRWWTTKVSETDGVITFSFVPDVFDPQMRVEQRVAPSTVAWTCVGGAEQWAGASIRFDVRPHEGGSRLTFRQGYGVELDDDSFGIYNFNWGYYLQSLREYCESGTGKPFRAP
jgi:hypothetical protein